MRASSEKHPNLVKNHNFLAVPKKKNARHAPPPNTTLSPKPSSPSLSFIQKDNYYPMESTVSPLTELILPNLDSYLQSLAGTLSTTPGQPVSNPTSSFWLSDPPPVFTHQSPTFLAAVDVLIISGGITGTAAARTLLSNSLGLRVVMLDAREACSGATGRNGVILNLT